MRKVKGFTLVELLAVIVILAIILAIAIPAIGSIVQSSRKGALESQVKLILRAAFLKYGMDSSYDFGVINRSNLK